MEVGLRWPVDVSLDPASPFARRHVDVAGEIAPEHATESAPERHGFDVASIACGRRVEKNAESLIFRRHRQAQTAAFGRGSRITSMKDDTEKTAWPRPGLP